MKLKKLKKFKVFLVLIALCFGVIVSILFYYSLDPALLAKISFYLDLANPSVRIIRIQEGLRKEEVAEVMANKLGWDENAKNNFINAHLALNTTNQEGHYFPETYLINKDEGPSAVSAIMFNEFSKKTEKIKQPKSKQIINPETALKIASIIQRESDGKTDMKLISGIIWNRIWSGMKLQIDATVQYAKGNEEDGWWKEVNKGDTKIKSPYNTYLYPGLPPGAIANPGLAAIEAAYNPQKTDCMFYLHDKRGKIHCAKTYEEHKKNIETYY
ncbi:MAG: endolytic transglycosylase MltG [Candidatus Paceibacterota bacterium]